MKRTEINDAVNFAVSEMNKSKKIKTHEVVSADGVEFQGTKDGCAVFKAANEPFYEILGKKLKVRKIK